MESLPNELEKVWTISRAENKVQVTCNGEQVFTVTLSDDTCTDDESWQSQWSQQTAGIKFSKEWDTASDNYRFVPLEGGQNSFLFILRLESRQISIMTQS